MDVERSTARLLELAGQGQPRPAIALGLGLLTDGVPLQQVIVEVLAAVQREVGRLWESNRWSVADEHAATAVVDGVLGALALEAPVRAPRCGEVLVACAEGELHTVPARMGVELLRIEGWEVTFLGGSLPADDLQRFAAEREPDAVVISCTVPLFLPGARRCFTAVGQLGLPAVAAGAAFGADARRALRLGARGWLGPALDLATVLADHLQPEPVAAPLPREAVTLELEHKTLQAACLSIMVERMPVMAASSAAQLKSTDTDVGYILEFVRIAVDLDEDEIFVTFVAWLSGILASRNVPTSVLDRSLQIISEVLVAQGMEHAARLCAVHGESNAER